MVKMVVEFAQNSFFSPCGSYKLLIFLLGYNLLVNFNLGKPSCAVLEGIANATNISEKYTLPHFFSN